MTDAGGSDISDSAAWGGLMVAAQSGDGVAYTRLLGKVVPYIRAIICRRHASPDRVDDVVQDVLLSVHRVRHTYDPTRSFANWIGAIADRRAIDALRRKGRIDAFESPDVTGYETFADPRANSEIEAQETRVVLGEALAALPPGQRRAVELLKLRELSLAEAAHLSGQSEGSLKVSMHRALQSLRKLLTERDDGPH